MYVGGLGNCAEFVEGKADIALLAGINGFAAKGDGLAAEPIVALDEMHRQAGVAEVEGG